MRELPCPGCGALFQDIDGPVHRYMESSAGCWAAYGEVLAREYTDPRYAHIHRLTVDAYAVQHPGRPSPQSIQSVAVHLISLCLILEYDVDMHRATEAIGVAIQAKGKYRWLPPPVGTYTQTVADVQKARTVQEHHDLVHAWAKCVWSFWSEHHATISHRVAVGESPLPSGDHTGSGVTHLMTEPSRLRDQPVAAVAARKCVTRSRVVRFMSASAWMFRSAKRLA